MISVLKVSAFLLLCVAASTFATEQRCTELGANCICSEPLNTDTLVQVATYSLNPADSIIKECTGADGVPGGSVVGNPLNQITTGNAAGVLGAFPSGHSVDHYLRGIEGHAAVWWTGHEDAALAPTFLKRTAFRWYVYHSAVSRGDPTDAQFKGDPGCENVKFAQSGPVWDLPASPALHISAGGLSTWTYDNGTKTVGDCCWVGPPVNVDGVGAEAPGAPQTRDDWRGDWWRIEIIFTNRAGGTSPNGTVIETYAKNVSTGADEVRVIDTSVPDSAVGRQNDWLGWDDLTPTADITSFMTNNYRQGACDGFRAMSHYMVAGWDTDTGQRIGPAAEIEGAVAAPGVFLMLEP